MDRMIQKIAESHGVILSKDDPILMLHTFNQHLMEQNAQQHKALLQDFRNELELIHESSNDALSKKAEKMIQRSIESSTEQMTILLDEMNSSLCNQFSEIVDKKLQMTEATQIKSERLAYFNLCAAGLTFLAACAIGFVFILQ